MVVAARALVAVILFASVAVHADPDDAKRKARAMRAYTLTEELSLDEATAGKLFPLLAKFDAEADKLAARRNDVQVRLLATTAKTDAHAIDAMVDELQQTTRWQRDLEDRRFGELRKVLVPAQIAKIVVILPDLDAGIAVHASGRTTVDDDDRDAPMTKPLPAPKPGNAKKCDPFNSLHGCR